MKNKFGSLLVASATFVMLLQFSSCAMLQRYKCNKEYAAKKGMDDADNARMAMPARLEGNSCEGEYSASDYSKDYNFGFQQKKNEICQAAMIASYGRTDGENGASNRPGKTKIAICADRGDMPKINSIYENEFKKAFCAPARAAKLGTARAHTWQAADFETPFNDCKTNLKNLKSSYMAAFTDAMKLACTPVEAEKMAASEANARRDGNSVRQNLSNCTVNKMETLAAFDRAYKMNHDRVAQEDAANAAAAAQAARNAKVAEFMRTSATATFGFQLRSYTARCAVSDDRSYVRVEVENPYPDQILIQGNWRVTYYNSEFAKITEDRTAEAVLVTGNNRKTFQKLTLPKDAIFCRAEYIGAAMQ